MDLLARKGVFDNMLTDEKILPKRPEIHRLSVQSKLLGEKTELPMKSFPEVQVTKEQNRRLVNLEKVMDWHVLKARMNAINDNENCDLRGNLSENKKQLQRFEKEKNKLKKEFWIDFPIVSMRNGFGIHWAYNDDDCKSNSFAFKDAVHYALNNVTYSYEEFERLQKNKEVKPFKKLMIEEADSSEELEGLRIGDYVQIIRTENKETKQKISKTLFGKFGKLKAINQDMDGEIGKGDYVLHQGMLQKIEYVNFDNISINDEEMPAEPFGEIKSVEIQLINENKVLENIPIGFIGRVKRPWMLDQSTYENARIRDKFRKKFDKEENIGFTDYDVIMKDKYRSIEWTEKKVTSIFNNKYVTETLSFDSRLLKRKKLDIPMICIPSILRYGTNDFHTVYLEGDNALGQLEKDKKDFAVILIVRQEQKEIYAKRYYSDHTYFVALDPRLMYEHKGYSAGDSKFYAYRVADYLYDLWDTPINEGKRRVLIMDDQVQPFEHQIPKYYGNDNSKSTNIKPDTETFYAGSKTEIVNDTYKFRSTLKDEKKSSMMYDGNSRFLITHAACIMYMNKVADIMEAGLVCASSNEAEQTSMVVRRTPYKNIVWLFDLERSKIPGFSAPIPPAYRAAEDTMMSNVLISHGIRVVTCNTIRFRKSVTGGGTSGRNKTKPKPFMPIIAYHELLRAAIISPEPKLNKGELNGKKELVDVGYPFEEFYISYKRKKVNDDYKITTRAIEFKVRGIHYNMKFKDDLEVYVGPTLMGWKHPYGSRHRINLMALYGLKKIISETLQRGTNVKVKWLDGKTYNGKIDSFNEEEKKYKVIFPDGTFDFIDDENIKTVSLKF